MTDILTGALGVALITSLLAPYLLQTTERRKARANVVSAIYEVELSRWASAKPGQFPTAIRTLRTAALIARIDRKMTEHYVYIAGVCNQVSAGESEENNEPEEYKGFIPLDLDRLSQDAAEALVILLWHPWRSKFFKKNKLKKLQADMELLKKEDKKQSKKLEMHNPIFWDVRY